MLSDQNLTLTSDAPSRADDLSQNQLRAVGLTAALGGPLREVFLPFVSPVSHFSPALMFLLSPPSWPDLLPVLAAGPISSLHCL